MKSSRITVLIPGQTLPKQTISARTSGGLKNYPPRGPALKYFFSISMVLPGVNLHCLITNSPGESRVSYDKKGSYFFNLIRFATKLLGYGLKSFNSKSTIKLLTLLT